MERKFKMLAHESLYENLEDLSNEELEEKTDRMIQTNISSVEFNTGMKLKRIEGLVNGKPTYCSTFVFGADNIKPFKYQNINYDKSNINLNNLISLCRLCHGSTHSNREEWQKIFTRTTQNV